MHASTGILFNHEYERRGFEFVTRKISRAASFIKLNKQKYIILGNLEAKRDWGYAPEYIQAMWLMLQQPKPDDYVVGTGETYSIKYFLENAFDVLGLNYQKYLKINKKFFRPSEVDLLVADLAHEHRIRQAGHMICHIAAHHIMPAHLGIQQLETPMRFAALCLERGNLFGR